ncbi:hypothetical protein E5676_scaffold347G00140 [Cucumis melo var. makuwa]|uniref:Uncharacterized protein n=1 Tax=Cucumis melo var. makuwa TaxID=1194695 RepID=A0A5D3BVS3_CUCMM|nr:hypothetical protein E5676_scaffold347G00140 [Cucumis melo var. makuwa]
MHRSYPALHLEDKTAAHLGCKAEKLPILYLGHVATSLEKIMRNFFWKDLLVEINHPVKWSLVSLPLKDGGLGLGGIEIHNLALLAKWD